MSYTLRTLRDLPSLWSRRFASVIFGSRLCRVASVVLFSAASWWVSSSLGRLPSSMGRSQFRVIVEVVATWSCCLISHSLLALSIGTVGFTKCHDPVTILPPSHFLGRLLSFPVSRSRRSVPAIYTLFGGILMPPPSLPTAPWWRLGRPRRRIALSR